MNIIMLQGGNVMRYHTETMRTKLGFQDFLNAMIYGAFPDAFSPQKGKIIPARCPKAVMALCRKIEREAYPQDSLYPNSMLSAIDSAMHHEYGRLLHQLNFVTNKESIDNGNSEVRMPQTVYWSSYVQHLPRCFPAKFTVQLPATLDMFHLEMSTFCEPSRKWYNWLRKNVHPHAHDCFRLMRLLIYGIL